MFDWKWKVEILSTLSIERIISCTSHLKKNVYLEINEQYKSNYFAFVDLIRMLIAFHIKITELYEVSKIS